jgi:hypothetical protein
MSGSQGSPRSAREGAGPTAVSAQHACRWLSLAADGVTQLFVHSSTSLHDYATLVARTPNVAFSTPKRALLLAEEHDIVCLASPIDPDFFAFLEELGLGPRRESIVVLADGAPPAAATSLAQRLLSRRDVLERVGALVPAERRVVVSPYVVSDWEVQLVGALSQVLGRAVGLLGGNPGIVDRAYRKHIVKAKARELGVPVVDGDVVALDAPRDGGAADVTVLREAIARQRARTGRVLVRGSYGTAATSTFIAGPDAESTDQLLAEIARRDDNRFYVVEPLVDFVVSPNVQMYVDPFDGGIECLNITDQTWHGELRHGGNVFPSRAATAPEMGAAAARIAEWMRDRGYTGIVGFDFVEYLDPQGAARFFLAEANPRINGATYPTKVVERLARLQERAARPAPRAFATRRVHTRARTFAEFRELHGEIFFNAKTGRGIVPLTPVSAVSGRVPLMIAGSSRDDVVREHEALADLIADRES